MRLPNINTYCIVQQQCQGHKYLSTHIIGCVQDGQRSSSSYTHHTSPPYHHSPCPYLVVSRVICTRVYWWRETVWERQSQGGVKATAWGGETEGQVWQQVLVVASFVVVTINYPIKSKVGNFFYLWKMSKHFNHLS